MKHMKRNRVNRVLENMEKMGLDQLIVGEPASVYYLTGRWIEPGERMLALLISKGRGMRAVREPAVRPGAG